MTAAASVSGGDGSTQAGIRRPQQRFVVLDGLRGIAAIAVVVYHTSFLRYAVPDVLQSAYLAVDCFFMMSGFVLCLAYHRMLEEGRVGSFMLKRWSRLAPVWWVGLALCVVELVFFKFSPNLPVSLIELVSNVAMLPLPFAPTGELFRLNLPGWSLFYELVINLAYAAVGYRLGIRGLAAVMLVSAAVLVATTSAAGMTNGGLLWSEAPVALARVTYGFLAGALLYRLRLPTFGKRTIASLVACVAVLLIFAADLHGEVRWYFDLAATFVGLPLIVAVGTLIDAPRPMGRIFDFIGKASYPLYAIHWPAFVIAHQLYGRLVGWVEMPLPIVVALVLVLIVTAHRIGVLLDPFAGRLGRRLDRRAKAILSTD